MDFLITPYFGFPDEFSDTPLLDDPSSSASFSRHETRPLTSIPDEKGRLLSPQTQGSSCRHGLYLFSAIALMLLGSEAKAETFPAAGTAYIAPPPGYHVNIRNGPGTAYRAVNTLRRGTSITLNGRYSSDGWAQLNTGAWVAGNLVNSRPPTGIGVGPAPAAGRANPSVAYVASSPGFSTNVRSGPGLQYPVVNTLTRGTAINLSGEYRNGWARLLSGNWIAERLIQAEPPTAAGTPPAEATVAEVELLQRGSQGEAVTRLQQRLKGLGYLASDATLTDIYGDLTEQAVREFQRKNALPVDGVAGVRTLEVLYSNSAIAMPAPDPDPTGFLQQGSEGPAVAELQRRLQTLGYLPSEASIDEVFGEQTEQALKDFQQRNRLTADGVAGARTLDILYSETAIAQATANAPAANPPSTVEADVSAPTPAPQSESPTGGESAVEPASPAETSEPAVSTPGTIRSVQVATDNGMDALIFSGPGTEHELLGFIPDGSTVKIAGNFEGNWAQLEDGSWIYSQWVDLQP